MFEPIIIFIVKYWKAFAIPLALAGAYFYGYYRGTTKANLKLAEKQVEVLIKRQEETIKEQEKNSQIKNKILKIRTERPADDKRDSCLLSGDPYHTKCID